MTQSYLPLHPTSELQKWIQAETVDAPIHSQPIPKGSLSCKGLLRKKQKPGTAKKLLDQERGD